MASENETANTFSSSVFSFFFFYIQRASSPNEANCAETLLHLSSGPVPSFLCQRLDTRTPHTNGEHMSGALFIRGARAGDDHEDDFSGEASGELGDVQQQIFENTFPLVRNILSYEPLKDPAFTDSITKTWRTALSQNSRLGLIQFKVLFHYQSKVTLQIYHSNGRRHGQHC